MDAPGEWYLDRKEHILYLYPEQGTDLAAARLEAGGLEELVKIQGEGSSPVRNVTLQDLVLTGTRRTFMENREPLLRSDWTIFRSGAVLLRGTEGCRILSCEFARLGGTAVFVDGNNENLLVRSCYIHDIGSNGVAFVGTVPATGDRRIIGKPKECPWRESTGFRDLETMNFPGTAWWMIA